MSTENRAETATQTPCPRCDGCGQLANSDDREPWSVWLALPLQSALAVTMGLVKPEPCDECGGTGKATAQPAGQPCGCPSFTTHTTHGNPWCQCGHQYSSHTSPGAACTMTASPINEHRPIGVRSTDVGAFIRCSCGSNPTPHYWLNAHWPGDKSEGERLLRELASAIGGGA